MAAAAAATLESAVGGGRVNWAGGVCGGGRVCALGQLAASERISSGRRAEGAASRPTRRCASSGAHSLRAAVERKRSEA